MNRRWIACALSLLIPAACQVNIDDYVGRACDDAHPCPPSSGRQCIRNLCQRASADGGTPSAPTLDTVGVPPGTTLTPSGSQQVTEPGKVMEHLDITGCVTVQADHVTLRSLRIRGNGVCTGSLLDLRDATGTLVEDVEIDGTNHPAQDYAVMGGDFTLRRVWIHQAWTGIRITGNNVTLEDSIIHGLTSTSNGAALVASGGQGFTFRNNILEVEGPGDGVIVLYSQNSAIRNVLAEANLINGGGWSVIAAGDAPSRPSSDIRFLRNRFGRKFHAQCGVYGPVSSFDPSGEGNLWEGNVWDDTGEPLPY